MLAERSKSFLNPNPYTSAGDEPPVLVSTFLSLHGPQEVAAAHKLLVAEVRRLFDTYKGVYGWANRQLEIL